MVMMCTSCANLCSSHNVLETSKEVCSIYYGFPPFSVVLHALAFPSKGQPRASAFDAAEGWASTEIENLPPLPKCRSTADSTADCV